MTPRSMEMIRRYINIFRIQNHRQNEKEYFQQKKEKKKVKRKRERERRDFKP